MIGNSMTSFIKVVLYCNALGSLVIMSHQFLPSPSLALAMGTQVAADCLLSSDKKLATLQLPEFSPISSIDITSHRVGHALAWGAAAFIISKKPSVTWQELVHLSIITTGIY